MFCPKCGSILRPSKDEKGERVMQCSCGYSDKKTTTVVKDVMKQTRDVEVVDRDIETLPTCADTCPKCGHEEAYYWLVQTRAGDEPETKFLKCAKCKHTWRDYD